MSPKFLPPLSSLPLISGDAGLPEGLTDAHGNVDFAAINAHLFLGYHPPTFAQHLARLNDGLPLPQVFNWRPPETQDESLAAFDSEARRLIKIMTQLLEQKRKSSKYAEAFRALMQSHPNSELLGLMQLNYLELWSPAEASAWELEQLAAHPDWLEMRFCRAAVLMIDVDPESPDPAALEEFLRLLNLRLELHEHLEGWPDVLPSDGMVSIFYTATASYFIATGQYYRAIYSLTMAAAADDAAELETLMQQLLLKLLNQGKMPQLRQFLTPLWLDRERRREGADSEIS